MNKERMRFHIRPFHGRTDTPQLTLLRFPAPHLRRYRNALPFWALLKLARLCTHYMFVMTPSDSDRVIGTMVLRSKYDFHDRKIAWRLHAMFVLPEFRRQGLGEALLAHATSELVTRSADRVTLKVDSDNAPAVSLYRKFGFLLVSKVGGQSIYIKQLQHGCLSQAAPQTAIPTGSK